MGKHILVDLDKTLARYNPGDYHRFGPTFIGEPIEPMVRRVRNWLSNGREVKIFTARVAPPHEHLLDTVEAIQAWCKEHIGQVLPIVHFKTRDTVQIWDDRAVGVRPNQGITL